MTFLTAKILYHYTPVTFSRLTVIPPLDSSNYDSMAVAIEDNHDSGGNVARLTMV